MLIVGVGFALLLLLLLLSHFFWAAQEKHPDVRACDRRESQDGDTDAGRPGLTRRSFTVLASSLAVSLVALRRIGRLGIPSEEVAALPSAAAVEAVEAVESNLAGPALAMLRRARCRAVVPVSSSVCIPRGASARVTARLQSGPFLADRLIIQGSEEWIVEDIRVGAVSQLVVDEQGLPGGLFSPSMPSEFSRLSLPTVSPGTDLSIQVRYVGDLAQGRPLYACFLGDVMDTDAVSHLVVDEPGPSQLPNEPGGRVALPPRGSSGQIEIGSWASLAARVPVNSLPDSGRPWYPVERAAILA